MQKLLIGTKNPGKQKEIAKLLSNLFLAIVYPQDIGIDSDVGENGKTYKENSQKKALFYAKKSGLPTIADDGGLEIAALDNAPGVKSKRWIGQDATEEDLIKHMLKVAKDLPNENRIAWFKTVISFALPDGKVWSASGEIKGIIAKKPYMKLLKGYPYRSFFYLPELKKFYHERELTEGEMKYYNHRHKAIEKIKPLIKKYI